jgi:predicted TPR repeat methyltransferase
MPLTERRRKLGPAYFEALYAEQRDPWRFESSRYEQRKYRHTLAALGPSDRRFARALEIGCSIGVFSQLLAPRCEELLAVDVAEQAVDRARMRLADRPGVRVEQRELPEQLPPGPWDLIVCSEVLYYWDGQLLSLALPLLVEQLAPGGSLLAVHWRPATRTYPLLGDEVHDLLTDELAQLEHAESATEPLYRLDRWDRPLEPRRLADSTA